MNKKLDSKVLAKLFKQFFLKEVESGRSEVNRKALYWVAAFFMMLLTAWMAFFHKSDKKPQENRIVPVEVETVSTGSIEDTIELTGMVKANAVVNIESRVPGRVESLQAILNGGSSVPVEEGLAVKRGEQLAVIDREVYLAQVAVARAAVKAAEVELADAEREKKRIIALYEGGSATEQNRDKAMTGADLAAARLNSAKANLELAEINLRESIICSPIDGVVTAKHIDQGNLIKSGDRLVTVADIKTAKVIVAVAEKYGSRVLAGMPVRIRVDAFPEKVFEAKVYSVYPAADEQTHTIQIEIRVDNNECLLKPGMFARVTLIAGRKENVVVVQRDVVLGGKIDEPYVYVAEGVVAHKRIVKKGIIQSDRCEITEGLNAGEKLVVNGMNYLTDGTGIEIVQMKDIK